jgi:hypothetical protein
MTYDELPPDKQKRIDALGKRVAKLLKDLAIEGWGAGSHALLWSIAKAEADLHGFTEEQYQQTGNELSTTLETLRRIHKNDNEEAENS